MLSSTCLRIWALSSCFRLWLLRTRGTRAPNPQGAGLGHRPSHGKVGPVSESLWPDTSASGVVPQIMLFISFHTFFFFFFFFNWRWWFLPYIHVNQPWVYMCSLSWPSLPPPSSSHPSGSSQCTSPEHPVSCIKLGLAIYFTYDNIHVSMLFSQIIPPSPSLAQSISLFFVSLLLSRIWGHHYHLSKSHMYVLIYCIGVGFTFKIVMYFVSFPRFWWWWFRISWTYISG